MHPGPAAEQVTTASETSDAWDDSFGSRSLVKLSFPDTNSEPSPRTNWRLRAVQVPAGSLQSSPAQVLVSESGELAEPQIPGRGPRGAGH